MVYSSKAVGTSPQAHLDRRTPFSGLGLLRNACHSPKFCSAAKSTACTLSSARQFAMTVLHVPLLPTVVRTTGALLSFVSHTALGELGTPAATCSTKTKTSSSKTPPDGQALLGPGPPVLGRLEKVAPGRHSRNCGALASCRISALLELDLEGEKTGRQKGRKRLSKEIRNLIFRMVAENPTWGAPRIHGEVLMLGFDVSERSISRWMKRAP
jgi:hypothetical protein